MALRGLDWEGVGVALGPSGVCVPAALQASAPFLVRSPLGGNPAWAVIAAARGLKTILGSRTLEPRARLGGSRAAFAATIAGFFARARARTAASCCSAGRRRARGAAAPNSLCFGSNPANHTHTAHQWACGSLLFDHLQQTTGEQYDVVLSSGFLAFANHSGFLQAVEEVREEGTTHVCLRSVQQEKRRRWRQ